MGKIRGVDAVALAENFREFAALRVAEICIFESSGFHSHEAT